MVLLGIDATFSFQILFIINCQLFKFRKLNLKVVKGHLKVVKGE